MNRRPMTIPEGCFVSSTRLPGLEASISPIETQAEYSAYREDRTAPGVGIRRRLQRDGIWVLVGRVLGVSMTVLGNIFLARVLGTAAFGAFTLIATIMFLASTVATLGMGGVIVRTIAESLASPTRVELDCAFAEAASSA